MGEKLAVRGQLVPQREMTLEDRAHEVAFRCFGKADYSDCPYAAHLVNELEKGVYWSGVFWWDFAFLACNRHPVLGIVCCHSQHPLGKWHRAAIYAFIAGVTFLLCFFIKLLQAGTPDALEAKLWGIVLNMFVSVVMLVATKVLVFWATVHSRRPINCCLFKGVCCLLRCASRLIFAVVAVVSVLLIVALAVAYHFLKIQQDHQYFGLFTAALLSQLTSLILWFPT
eukprot:CAMPEP_0198553078 /NCGR_PEP_ID=MMETSP1462-20131121/79817_1 /TAXON_ID=1333877 /ORGANISM="Brandtodinium nutriculum, Strain RCC3387" /LENGTH=225 /DNA_ID=CAMNT_0044283755 /DNA_START=1 /DNA_END=675 /DNA_ORIENTATION=+